MIISDLPSRPVRFSNATLLIALASMAGNASAGGADAFGYIWDDAAFAAEGIASTGNALLLADDQTTNPISLGFDFDFYGSVYGSVSINANGFITFASSTSGVTWNPSATLPDPVDTVNNLIAGYWEDLNNPAGNIRYQTLGTPGSQRFVVGYYDVPHYQNGPLTSFEIVLYEGTNNITLNYLDTIADSDGNATVIGLENADSTVGMTIASGDLNLSQQSYAITHPGFESVAWAIDAGGGWDTAANWSGGVLPGARSDVTISRAVPVTVSGPTSATTIHRLTVGGEAFNTLELGNSSLTVNDRVDVQAGGVVRLAGGDLTTRSLTVDTAAELEIRNGDLVLEGGDLSWQRDFDLPASYDGVYGVTASDLPRLILRNGATGLIDHASENINFSSMRIGDNSGGGSLQVLEGSTLEVAGSAGLRVHGFTELGQPTNMPSSLIIDGVGSVLTLSRTDGLIPSLSIGGDLSQLSVTNGGVIESAGGLRLNNGAQALVSGTDSRIATTDRTTWIRHEGNREQGTSLTINGGAEVLINIDGRHDISATSLSFSPFSATTTVTIGETNVSGDPSRLYFSGDLDLRAFQSDDIATINVLDGGILEVAGTTSINDAAGQIGNDFGAARILVNGGTFRTQSIRADLSQSPGAGLFFERGAVEVFGPAGLEMGSLSALPNLTVNSSRTLDVGGQLRVRDGQLFVVNGGLLKTGSLSFDATSLLILAGGTIETGSLHRVDGALDFSAGLLHVQSGAISGYTNTDFVLGYVGGGSGPQLRLSDAATFALDVDHTLEIETGILNVDSGSVVSAGDVLVAKSPGTTAQVFIQGQDGQSAPATLRAWNTFTIGGSNTAAGGDGRVEVGPGGLLDVEQGILSIWNQGTNELVLNGGEIRADSLDINGNASRFNWISGTFFYENDLLVASNGDMGASVVLNPGMDFYVTDHTEVRDTGMLSINGGSFRTTDLVLQPGATFSHNSGELRIEGGTFALAPATNFTVGGSVALVDQPELTVAEGATMSVDGGLYIGDAGALNGTVDVRSSLPASPSAINTAFFVLGEDAASRGILDVLSGGELNAPFFSVVGSRGYGKLSVNSGTATTSGVIAGLYPGSDGDISVINPGAYWSTTGTTYFGSSGSGSLWVSNGGTVDAEDIWVAQNPGSDGTVTVGGLGPTSTLNVSDDLFLGGVGTPGGPGVLNIYSGGVVDIADTLTIYGSAGTEVRLQGGELRVGSIDLQGTVGQLTNQWTAGTLAITGPAGLTIDNVGTFGPLLSLSDQQHLESVYLTVGDTGQLSVENGALLTVTSVFINSGIGNNAELRLDGAYNGESGGVATATFTTVGQLPGFDGAGDNELTIHSGSYQTGSLIAGLSSGSSGLVTVGIADPDAADALLTVSGVDSAIFGLLGRGSLTVFANGVVDIQDSLAVGVSGGSGAVLIDGGNLEVTGDFDLTGSGSSLTITGGQVGIGGTLTSLNSNPITLDGGGLLSVGRIDFGGNASLFDWQSGALLIDDEETIIQQGADLGGQLTLDAGKLLFGRQVVVGDTAVGRVDLIGGNLQIPSDGLTIGRSAGSDGSLMTVSAPSPSLFALNVQADIVVGQGSQGRLEISGGGKGITQSGGLLLATEAGGVGSSLEVWGEGSLLQIADALVVGGAAEASAIVRQGGAIEVGASVVVAQGVAVDYSLLRLEGAGTRVTADALAIAPGQNSFGEVQVDGGALLVVSNDATVGALAGTSGGGLLWVSGAETIVDIGGGLTIAPSGSGVEQAGLVISLGALVDIDGALIANATGVVEFNDGTLRVGSLSARNRLAWDTGLLDITATGLDLAADLADTLTVDADKRLRVAANLSVGGANPTQLNILSGGLVESGGGQVGTANNVAGHRVLIDGAGSQWTIDNNLTIGQLTGGAPGVEVNNGGNLNGDGTIKVVSTATLGVDQGVVQANQIIVGVDLNPAPFNKGLPLAVLLEGGALLTDGVFNLGLSPAKPGQLQVSRQSANAGRVDVQQLLVGGNSAVDLRDGRIEAEQLVRSLGRFDIAGSAALFTQDLVVSGEVAGADQYPVMRIVDFSTILATGQTSVGTTQGQGAGLFISGSAEVFTGTQTNIATQPNQRGQLTLAGTNALWHAQGDVHVGGIGNTGGSTGLLRIGDGLARVDSVLHVYDTGQTNVKLLGGKLKAGSIDTHGNASRFEWLGGELELDTFTVGSSGPLGVSVVVDNLRPGLTVLGDTVVETDGSLTLDGGAVFTTGGLDTSGIPSNFTWGQGTLDLTADDLLVSIFNGPLGFDVRLDTGQNLQLRNDGVVQVDLSGQFTLAGGSLRTGSLDLGGSPSRFAWTGGDLWLTDTGLTVSSAGTLGNNLVIPVGGSLTLSQAVSEQLLTVGDGSAGTLTIQNGSWVESDSGRIGVGSAAGLSVVSVGDSGPGDTAAWLVNGGLSVGGNGAAASHNAELRIGQTGIVDVTGTLKIHALNGQVLLQGGELYVGGLDTDGDTTGLDWTGGHLSINPGDLTIGVSGALGDSLTIGSERSLDVHGLLQVGDSDIGTLLIHESGVVTGGNAAIGIAPGSIGSSVTVLGPDALWDLSGNINVGSALLGDLNQAQLIIDAGTVQSQGTVAILENGGLQVINSGGLFTRSLTLEADHTLSIADGLIEAEQGSTRFDTLAIDGGTGGAIGTLRLIATTSAQAPSDVVVGTTGQAALEVLANTSRGAVFTSSGTAVFGDQATASGDVLIAGRTSSSQTRWTHSGPMIVGDAGDASLHVTSQALLQTGQAIIGNQSTSSAHVVIDQGGLTRSTWAVGGSLYLGGSDTAASGADATITVGNFGVLQVDDDLVVYDNGPTSPRLILNSQGQITTGRLLTDGRPENFAFNGGTLKLTATGVDLSSIGQLGSTLSLNDGMTLDTQLGGVVSIASTGTLNLAAGGTLITQRLNASAAAATFNWTGGLLRLTATDLTVGPGGDLGSALTLGPDQVLDITAGSLFIASGGGVNLSGGAITAQSIDTGGDPTRFNWTSGQLSLTDQALLIGPGGPLGSLTLDNGMQLSVTQSVQVVGPGDAFTLGNQSTFSTNGAVTIDSNTGNVAVKLNPTANNATWTSGAVSLGGASGNALVLVQPTGTGSASVGSGNLSIATTPGGAAQVILDGDNASWSAGGSTIVGGTASADGGTGTLQVLNGASFSTGLLRVRSGSASLVRLDGGSISATTLDTDANPAGFEWIAGDLTLNSITVGSAGPLGSSITLDDQHQLTINSTTTVATGGTIHLAQGQFATRYLDLGSDAARLNWTGGPLRFTGSNNSAIDRAGNLGESWLIDNGQTLIADSFHRLYVGDDDTGLLTITDGSVSAGQVVIANAASSNGAVLVSGSGSSFAASYQQTGLIVGNAGVGTFTVDNGAQATSRLATVGGLAGSTGRVTVTGLGSSWAVNTNLTIGASGDALVTVSDSASLSAQNFTVASNTIEAILQLSQDATASGQSLNIGSTNTAKGLAELASGAQFNLSGSAIVGAAGEGTLRLTGNAAMSANSLSAGVSGLGLVEVDNATLSVNQDLALGSAGEGGLQARSGASVTVGGDLILGAQAFSIGRATLQGAGTSADVSGAVQVGVLGEGELTIEQAAQLHSGSGLIAFGTLERNEVSGVENNIITSFGLGQVTLRDAGSRWDVDTLLEVGASGPATLSITDGAQLSAADLYAGVPKLVQTDLAELKQSEQALIVIDGAGSIATAQRMVLGGNDVVGGGQGAVIIRNGGQLIVTEQLIIQEGGSLGLLDGTLAAERITPLVATTLSFSNGRISAGQIDADLSLANATLAPGNSPGSTLIDGNLTMSGSATIEIEFAGTLESDYDRVEVTGSAALAGTLDLSMIQGYSPTPSTAYTVLSAAALNGTSFDTVLGRYSLPNFVLTVGYTGTDVVVTAIAKGDTDGDGDIDDADLGTSFASYTGPVGSTGGRTLVDGDFDGDGDVDDADLGTSFASYTGPMSPAAVPEPTTAWLVGLGGFALIRRRRRPAHA